MSDNEIGRAVRQVRGEMPQAELAARMTERLGYAWYQNTVTRVETGERPLRVVEAIVLASEFGVSLDMLCGQSSAKDVDLFARNQRLERIVTDLYMAAKAAIGDPLTRPGVL